MSLPLTQLQAIRTELDSNVELYGALSDAAAAAELMALDKTQVRARMTGSEVFANTDATEFSALTDAKRDEWLSLCAIDELNPANGTPGVQTGVRLFGAGSATVTALSAARQETVTRASQIGVGNVTTEDVRLARAL